ATGVDERDGQSGQGGDGSARSRSLSWSPLSQSGAAGDEPGGGVIIVRAYALLSDRNLHSWWQHSIGSVERVSTSCGVPAVEGALGTAPRGTRGALWGGALVAVAADRVGADRLQPAGTAAPVPARTPRRRTPPGSRGPTGSDKGSRSSRFRNLRGTRRAPWWPRLLQRAPALEDLDLAGCGGGGSRGVGDRFAAAVGGRRRPAGAELGTATR
ncbi:MAG TPA: hypothetical protein VHH53_03995, partial [Pseudonocardiaceae bacterium]|nr:hypothetical protein [Pseudonocardiaceae bacterium]